MVTLEVRNINKYYGEGENRVQVLKDVNLSIEKGDFVAIIGQSGSGKSTHPDLWLLCRNILLYSCYRSIGGCWCDDSTRSRIDVCRWCW